MRFFCFFGLLVWSLTSLFSQPTLERLEYEQDRSLIIAYSFKLPTCHEDVLTEEWRSQVKAAGGSSSLFREVVGRYKATDVQFAQLSEYGPMTVYFEVFPHRADSLIVSEAFQFADQTFVDPWQSSPQNKAAEEIMLDLSLAMRKACVNYEIDEALQYKDDLMRQIDALQRDNANLEKSATMSHHKIIKLEREAASLKGELEFYKRKQKENFDDFTIAKLQKEQDKTQMRHNRVNANLLRERANISESEIMKGRNLEKITLLKEDVKNQNFIIKSLTDKLKAVAR